MIQGGLDLNPNPPWVKGLTRGALPGYPLTRVLERDRTLGSGNHVAWQLVPDR